MIGVKKMTVQNLDSLINNVSYNMVKDMNGSKELINNIDKALGVLVNDGVYAYYVYCKSQSNRAMEQIYVKHIVDKFEDIVGLDTASSHEGNKYDNFFLNLSKDIHKLLFFKDILEHILIYARYHGKAVSSGGD
jgi:hypothetical protein